MGREVRSSGKLCRVLGGIYQLSQNQSALFPSPHCLTVVPLWEGTTWCQESIVLADNGLAFSKLQPLMNNLGWFGHISVFLFRHHAENWTLDSHWQPLHLNNACSWWRFVRQCFSRPCPQETYRENTLVRLLAWPAEGASPLSWWLLMYIVCLRAFNMRPWPWVGAFVWASCTGAGASLTSVGSARLESKQSKSVAVMKTIPSCASTKLDRL